MKNILRTNKFKSENSGFTLIELVVGMVIIITSATAVVVLLSSSFRVSSKTTSLEAVRASGNNAINLMQRTIQFADGFSGVSQDGVSPYSTSCPTISTTYSYVRVRSGNGTKQFSCTNTGGVWYLKYNQGGGDVDLIDTTDLANITSCQLTCSQNSESVAPVIGISFSLSLKSTSSIPDKNATVSFSTSAKMRNL